MMEGNGLQAPRPVDFLVYRDFLDRPILEELLGWAVANEARFDQPRVGVKNKVDDSIRVSMTIRDFGPARLAIDRRVREKIPDIFRDLRVTPFEPSKLETELVASNDGAFYSEHIDTFVGDDRANSDRVVSAIYYFHSEPKAFSGGALRIYPLPFQRKSPDEFVEIEPEQNTLVVFPSFLLHEVRPVSCPTRLFAHSRFSVNVWIHRK